MEPHAALRIRCMQRPDSGSADRNRPPPPLTILTRIEAKKARGEPLGFSHGIHDLAVEKLGSMNIERTTVFRR